MSAAATTSARRHLEPIVFACLVCATAAGGHALAQPHGEAVPAATRADAHDSAWSALSPSQRERLAPLRADWHRLDETMRRRWIGVADRFPTMDAPARERAQSRMAEWSRLSPDQRRAARERFREAQGIDPDERRARWDEYQSLTPEQRQHWAEQSNSRPATGAKPPAGDHRSAQVPEVPARGGIERSAATTASGGLRVPARLTDAAQARSPTHLGPGQSKIATSPALVDRATLLPRTGPQAALPRVDRSRDKSLGTSTDTPGTAAP